MIRVFSPDASRRLDAECIANGIPEEQLIEQASASCAQIIETIIQQGALGGGPRSILVACGWGNNGADGLMIASLLSASHLVSVLIPPPDDAVSPGHTYAMSKLAKGVHAYVFTSIDTALQQRPDVIIDALLGSGSRLPLDGTISNVTSILNSISALKIAVDLPTGLHALNGSTDEHVLRCDHTIAMEGLKPGHIRNAGPDVTGRLHIASIGAPDELSLNLSDGVVLEDEDVRALLPVRRRSSSKFDYGHVLVIGGSIGMRGAPSMTAHAALALGAGLVDVATPSLHPLTPREIMSTALAHHSDGTIAAEALDVLHQRIQRSGVIAMGPGVGANPRTIAMLAELIDSIPAERTLVLDADGLRCLPLLRQRRCAMIITPHLGELARILGQERQDIAQDYVEHAQRLAEMHQCVVHVKHVPAATTTDRHVTYLQCGNPALATAGSGDVLTGVIAGLRAQGMSTYDAARVGSWLHATSADEFVRQTDKASLMASELIDMIATVRGRLTDAPV